MEREPSGRRLVRRAALAVVAVLAGILPAFFLVFNSVFTDSGGPGERAFAFLLVGIGYGILGLVFGWLEPHERWRWGLWWAAAAVVILVWYTTREPQLVVLNFIVGLIALLAGMGGGEFGSRLRARRDARPGGA